MCVSCREEDQECEAKGLSVQTAGGSSVHRVLCVHADEAHKQCESVCTRTASGYVHTADAVRVPSK